MDKQELLKTAKPILFNSEMVRAILDGRKTVTRRVIKPQTVTHNTKEGLKEESLNDFFANNRVNLKLLCEACAPYKKGDILYVRETFAKGRIDYGENSDGTPEPYISQCTDDVGYVPKEYAMRHDIGVDDVIWKPSIHMPKEAARIFLKVTNVRCERLQDITVDECCREGCCSSDCYGIGKHSPDCKCDARFINTWNSTIKPADMPLYGWNANPWVWVYSFEVICHE